MDEIVANGSDGDKPDMLHGNGTGRPCGLMGILGTDSWWRATGDDETGQITLEVIRSAQEAWLIGGERPYVETMSRAEFDRRFPRG